MHLLCVDDEIIATPQSSGSDVVSNEETLMDFAVEWVVANRANLPVEFHESNLRSEWNAMPLELHAEATEVGRSSIELYIVCIPEEAVATHGSVPPLIGEAALLERASCAFGDLANTGFRAAVRLMNVWRARRLMSAKGFDSSLNFAGIV